jgi:ribosomal protein L11 methyltransferase
MNNIPVKSPIQDLFIYYIKGRVSPDSIGRASDFLGLWEEEDDAFLFFTKSSDDTVASVLDAQPHLELMDRFEMTYEQWHGGPIEPLTVGALHVIPPWHPSAGDRDKNTLLLDPGVVFGTGTHPTTQDCLTAVQLALTRRQVRRVIDLGAGTGLLSLAAIQMGGNACLALDLNRLAVETAWRNVNLNDMCEQILVAQGDAKNFMDLPCDLMVSNIHYDVMRHIVAGKGFQAPKQFILSGLLRSQASNVEARLMSGPAKILEKWERDGIWTTFYGEIVGR